MEKYKKFFLIDPYIVELPDRPFYFLFFLLLLLCDGRIQPRCYDDPLYDSDIHSGILFLVGSSALPESAKDQWPTIYAGKEQTKGTAL